MNAIEQLSRLTDEATNTSQQTHLPLQQVQIAINQAIDGIHELQQVMKHAKTTDFKHEVNAA